MILYNSVDSIWEILRLKETDTLFFSLTASIILYLVIYLIIKRAFTLSYSFLAGRLLKENLFFKENNASKPKTRCISYFFIFNMFSDIITNILFIFLSKYSFFQYFIKGYCVLRLLIFLLVGNYRIRLDSKYRKKEEQSTEYIEESIKKILETNPHFFDCSEPFPEDTSNPKYKILIFNLTLYVLFKTLLNFWR